MQEESKGLLDLESLVKSASYRAKLDAKARGEAKLKEPPKQRTEVLFLDPENWERKRGIALIHRDTDTLLGNFSEYVHKSVAACRKLVREETPISVEATEYVEGMWWLGEDRRPEPKQVWHEQRTAFLHVYLDKLRVHSPACEVVARLSYGSLARVELAIDTQFAQVDGTSEQLLFLPQGTNVIEVMSRDCKVALMQELGR